MQGWKSGKPTVPFGALTKSGNDTSVQGTNDDAQVSKLSCTNAGYFDDAFVQYFVRRPVRRSPLINRGYYARFAALRQLILQFLQLDTQAPKQIISLGAGFDATWFNLQAGQLVPAMYLEMDFPEVTQRKIASIRSHGQLHSLLQVEPAQIELSSKLITPTYCIMPADLRNLNSVQQALAEAKIDTSNPTLILSECVLVYIDPEASASLVSFLGSTFSMAAMVVYEQINPDDAFGRQMIENLESRGCPLKGIRSTPTLDAHKDRFLNNNWRRALAASMDTIYCRFIQPAERQRIEKLEIFDEYEEWHLIQEHYCLVIGVNDASGVFDAFGFPQLSA